MKKYHGKPRLIEKEFHDKYLNRRRFKDNGFVFVQDMSDLFANSVPFTMIREVNRYIKQFPETTFLLLTKNPKRYNEFLFFDNTICGATIETNRDYEVSEAPDTTQRYIELSLLQHKRKMVSIEPIMDFDLDIFVNGLRTIKPEFIYIGYDNYHNNLVEPSIEKVDKLIDGLEEFTEVREKPSVEKRRNEMSRV